MSYRIIGLLVVLWFIIYCANASAQEDSVDINNVEKHGRAKRKVSYYHPFLKDEKLTPEMQSLLMEVLQLERKKRALHRTKKKFRQFRNNSYHNSKSPLHKSKKFIDNAGVFTLPTTRLESVDDRFVSFITKPMSFWLKPLSSKHESVGDGTKKEHFAELKDVTKNIKEELLDLKENLDDIEPKQDDVNIEEKKIKETPELGPEMQGSEDVLGIDRPKMNKVIDEVLKDEDTNSAYDNSTYSKREIRVPLANESETQILNQIPMSINREVSVLTKPSFYWLNQNKKLVSNLLINNSMSSSNGSETNNMVSANNISSEINSSPSNPKILYYADSSPIHTSFESSSAGNSTANQNINGKSPEEKLEPTPLEALGLNRSAQETSNINVSKVISLTTKASQFWLNISDTTQNTTQKPEIRNVKSKKALNVTGTNLTISSTSIDNTTSGALVAKPINISAEVSLLTKSSRYWTDPYMNNTTETVLNVTKRIGYEGFTERVKMMAVNMTNIISLTNKPSKDWIYDQQAASHANTLSSNPHSYNTVSINNIKIPQNADLKYSQNTSLTNSIISSNNSLISTGTNTVKFENISLVRQPYAINEIPKEYFKQKEVNKTQSSPKNNPVTVDILENVNKIANAIPAKSIISPFQNVSNVPKEAFVEQIPANSLQGQAQFSRTNDLSMPKIFPENPFNNLLAAQGNPTNMKDGDPILFQNKSIMNTDINIPQVYYTGALSQFNGNQNGFGQSANQDNILPMNENSVAQSYGKLTAVNSNAPIVNSFSLTDFPKPSFLNETTLVQNLENPQIPNNNMNFKIRSSDTNLIPQNAFNANQNIGQYQNISIDKTNSLVPIEMSKNVNQKSPSDINKESLNNNIHQNAPSLQNPSVQKGSPLHEMPQSPLNQNGEFTQNQNLAQFNKTQLPYANNSYMMNNALNNGPNNRMFSSENTKPFVNNSFSINTVLSNEAHHDMPQFRDTVPLVINSLTKNPVPTKLTQNKMNNNVSQINCQGPGCIENNQVSRNLSITNQGAVAQSYGQLASINSNASSENSFALTAYPRPSILNETKLIQNVETPKFIGQYNLSNNEGRKYPQIQAQYNNENFNQVPQSFNINQNVVQFQNTSVDKNQLLAPIGVSQNDYQHENLNQDVAFNVNNALRNEDGYLNTHPNNLDSYFGAPLQNLSVQKQLPLHNVQSLTSETHQLPLNLNQNSDFIQNQNMAQFNQAQSPYEDKSSMMNTAFNNGPNNQMFNIENIKPFENKPFSMNSPLSNEVRQDMSQYHASVPLANNSLSRNSFSTNLNQNKMYNNVSQTNQLQGQVSIANNPLASSSFSTNQFINNVSHPTCTGPGCSQMYHGENLMQLQNFRPFAYNSSQTVPIASNQMLDNINQPSHCEGPGCPINSAFSNNMFLVKDINSQVPIVNAKPNNEVKPFGQAKNNSVISVPAAIKNTTEYMNKTQKKDLYYARFGDLGPFEVHLDNDIPEPLQYVKREQPMKVYSGKDLFQPHKYWKRDISDEEFDDEVKNDEDINEHRGIAQEFGRFRNHKRKKSPPIEISIQSGYETNDNPTFHKSIKRDFPVRDYKTEDQVYPETLDFGFDEENDGLLHKSIKRDFPVGDCESDEQLLHKIIKRDSPVNDDETHKLYHKVIKRDSPVNDDETHKLFHKIIKRDSPVDDDETHNQDNSGKVEVEYNVDNSGDLENHGSILRESLKSRSEGREINEDGTRNLLDSNLENPKFQKFLHHYVSDLALNAKRSRSDGVDTIELPTLVEALHNYIKSPYYTSESTNTTTTTSASLSQFNLSSSLDLIDMKSLLRTIDVISTADLYGYTLEEPIPSTKPSAKYEIPFDFEVATKMPYIFQPSPIQLSLQNMPSDNVIKKYTGATPLAEAIVKLRSAVAHNVATNLSIGDKLSKKFDANTVQDITENEFRTLLNSSVKKHEIADNLLCNSFNEYYDNIDYGKREKIGRSSGVVNGMNCNFNGSWLSSVAGMRIDLNQIDNRTFRVELASKTPPPKTGLLYTENCTDWLLSAKLPMKKTSILQVMGVNEKDKKLAVFLGECRVCNDKNLVYGHWIVLRESRDCEDIFSTQESYTDIWRQEGLHTLRLHNLQMMKMSLSMTEKPTGATSELATVNGTSRQTQQGNVTVASGSTGPSTEGIITSVSAVVPAVVTGVVPPEGANGGTVGTGSEVVSTAATNAVNIVVGRKRIAIRL